MLTELTIKRFLEKISSGSPVPGGGSVAALSGALAASLAEMVANLTIGRKDYEAVEDEMKTVAQDAKKLRYRLVQAVDSDSDAYGDVMTAIRLPGDTKEEKRLREKLIQDGLKHAVLIPMAVAEDAAMVMELAGKVVAMGNKNAVTDGAAGLILAKTAVFSALYNVRINLISVNDKVFVDKISKQAKDLEVKVTYREKELLVAVDL